MSQHKRTTTSHCMLTTTVVIATVLAASTVGPAEAASVVGTSVQNSSVVSVIEHIVGAIAVVFLVIFGIINNTLVKRLGLKSSEFVGLPGF